MCLVCGTAFIYSQPHLIGTWLIGSSGSDQDFTPDNHCYDRQVASLSVITMVRNHDHFLNSQLTRFRLSGVDCTVFQNDVDWIRSRLISHIL